MIYLFFLVVMWINQYNIHVKVLVVCKVPCTCKYYICGVDISVIKWFIFPTSVFYPNALFYQSWVSIYWHLILFLEFLAGSSLHLQPSCLPFFSRKSSLYIKIYLKGRARAKERERERILICLFISQMAVMTGVALV